MLKIKNLYVNIEQQPVLRGLNLDVQAGQVHAIMGPNGSGKSTLSYVLAGQSRCEVTKGQIVFDVDGKPKDLLALEPHERALEGLFLAFQYPVEVPGITNQVLLKTSFDAICKHHGIQVMSDDEFLNLLHAKLQHVGLGKEFLQRPLNAGLSGGEKKRNEILQLLVLNPRLAVLDETDSGLDVDALKIVAAGVNSFKTSSKAIIIITHYKKLLHYIKPDRVHILQKGRIVQSGGLEVAEQIEAQGYKGLQ